MRSIAKQCGITFSGFLMVAFMIVFVFIFGMKLIPAYLENAKIQKSFEGIVHDPELQSGTPSAIRQSFSKRGNIMNAVTAVNPEDLKINAENGRLTVSAKYTVTIPLAGNVSLLIEFNPSASSRN